MISAGYKISFLANQLARWLARSANDTASGAAEVLIGYRPVRCGGRKREQQHPELHASQGIHQLKQRQPGLLGNLLEQIIFAIVYPVLLCF
jgi:hypothetical protein